MDFMFCHFDCVVMYNKILSFSVCSVTHNLDFVIISVKGIFFKKKKKKKGDPNSQINNSNISG